MQEYEGMHFSSAIEFATPHAIENTVKTVRARSIIVFR